MYERQNDPIQPPPAVCPSCHRNTVLCEVKVVVCPDQKAAPVNMAYASLYGDTMITGQDKTFCNSNGCGWSGKFADARSAVLGTMEAISNGRGFRIWVQPSEVTLTDASQAGYTP